MSEALEVLYDEARIVVVDKPAGVTSEDAARALALKLVHRIDKATSGLLMLARDARTVQRMQRLLRAGSEPACGESPVERVYAFIAHGALADATCDTTLVDDRGDGKRGSGPGGKRAITHLRAMTLVDAPRGGDAPHGAIEALTVGEATLVTGRTHQVRIHLAERGHPIVGDPVYGAERHDGIEPRMFLHAHRLRFAHPNLGGAAVVVTSVVPASFARRCQGA